MHVGCLFQTFLHRIFFFFNIVACSTVLTQFVYFQINTGFTEEFLLVTNPESSGSPPLRAPPPVPVSVASPILTSLSKSQSLHSQHFQELSVDDIEDFEDEDAEEEIDSLKSSRRNPKDVSDLVVGLPSFETGNYV